MKTVKFIFSIWVAMLVSFTNFAHAESNTAESTVRGVAGEVLDIVKNNPQVQGGNIEELSRIVEEKVLPHFDVERMARASIGNHWNSSSKDQQAAFLAEFHKFVARSFILVLSQYHGQPINFNSTSSRASGTDVIVTAQIIEPDGDSEKIDFKMEQKGNVWVACDVRVEGISMVSNYHSQFVGLVVRSGVDWLIEKLAEKNKQPLSVSSTQTQKNG